MPTKSKRNNGSSRKRLRRNGHRSPSSANISPLTEVLFAAEVLLLHAHPVYYGFGVPRGDGSGVILIPGFLGTDLYMMEMHAWLQRIGYKPYFSGVVINAECPNLLIQRHLTETIERALDETGRKIHLVGHSLGGVIARAVAAQRPRDVASVITLAAPFRGTVTSKAVLMATEAIRQRILDEHGETVLPDCYTGKCTCNFVDSLDRDMPNSMVEAALYTRQDGIVDWRYCRTGDPNVDFELPGTHIGMAFNPAAYAIIAERLAQAQMRAANRKS